MAMKAPAALSSDNSLLLTSPYQEMFLNIANRPHCNLAITRSLPPGRHGVLLRSRMSFTKLRSRQLKTSFALRVRAGDGNPESSSKESGRTYEAAAGNESLDDMFPSLDSDSWNLLLERPAAPPPAPQQEVWADGQLGPSDPQSGWSRWPGQKDSGWGHNLSEDGWPSQPDNSSWRAPSGRPRGPQQRPDSSSFADVLRATPAEGWGPQGSADDTPVGEWGPQGRAGSTPVGQHGGVGGALDSATKPTYKELKDEHWNIRKTLISFLHGRYGYGEELSPSDMQFVIENALVFHPRAAAKMGSGVAAIKIDINPNFRDTTCFFLRTLDSADWEDFSYIKCLEARWAAKQPLYDGSGQRLQRDRPYREGRSSPGGREAGRRNAFGGRGGSSFQDGTFQEGRYQEGSYQDDRQREPRSQTSASF